FFSNFTSHSILSCISIIPLPPTSTLFPYTTLFRACVKAGSKNHPAATSVGFPPPGRRRLLWKTLYFYFLSETTIRGSTVVAAGLDRKSTRLNSSHVEISYAVFCLKKKKKIQQIDSY